MAEDFPLSTGNPLISRLEELAKTLATAQLPGGYNPIDFVLGVPPGVPGKSPMPGVAQFAPLLGMIHAPKPVVQEYRQIRKGYPQPPVVRNTGMENIVQNYVTALFRGPFWHGTARGKDILESGFRLPPETRGVRFGEPAGISLSASSGIAHDFGDLVRAGVRFGTQDVLPVIQASTARRPLLTAYRSALNYPYLDPPEEGTTFNDVLRRKLQSAASELVESKALPSSRTIEQMGWGDFVRAFPPTQAGRFNRALQQELYKAGIKGLVFSPKRYGEYEMLALNPGDVFPLEPRRWLGEADPLRAFGQRKGEQLLRFSQRVPQIGDEPDIVRSLSDIYRTFRVRDLLNP